MSKNMSLITFLNNPGGATTIMGNDVVPTLVSNRADVAVGNTQDNLCIVQVIAMDTWHCATENDISPTLKARDYKDPNILCPVFDDGK